jgi:tRNA-splicing ligase RtcB
MTAPLRCWISEPLDRAVEQSLERLRSADDVVRVAVMPDVHLADEVCVGTVMATSCSIYPSAIGGDIGCGAAAMHFPLSAAEVAERSDDVLRLLKVVVPILKHRERQALPDALGSKVLSTDSLERTKTRDGAVEFATVGRGTHFLEFQEDDEGCLWAMVHTGSRAMGPAIQRSYADPATRGMTRLDVHSETGRRYLSDHDWALEYARSSREAILTAAAAVIARLFGAEPEVETYRDCSHNLVRWETHGSDRLLVHRKGAIPAADGEAGMIPGSMGTPTFLVVGRGCEEALCSSSHGAGRRMSRGEAHTKISVRDLRRQMAAVRFDEGSIERLVDEAPAAYKDIEDVMRAQRELTKIVGRLRPVISYKG